MTSPTTSADAVKVLQELALLREHEHRLTDKQHAAVLTAIAHMTQHAEAGASLSMEKIGRALAAARNRIDFADTNHTPDWRQGGRCAINVAEALLFRSVKPYRAHVARGGDEATRWMAHPSAGILPAQPASQQGEKCERCDGSGVMVSDNHDEAPCVHCQPAHPAADKVRGLVEKWRKDAHASGSEWDEGYNTGRNCSADELAAALDQEKNDGR